MTCVTLCGVFTCTQTSPVVDRHQCVPDERSGLIRGKVYGLFESSGGVSAAAFLDREEERATVNREHVLTFDWCQAVTFNKTDGGRRSALTGATRLQGL